MIQKLTISILALSLVMGLTACEVSTTTNGGTPNPPHKTTPDDHMEEGGISAGGGGTLPADPIHVYEATKIVREAKRELRLLIRDRQRYLPSTLGDLDKKFYFGKENLATQLEKTDIEILEDKPCKDKFGRDVDASIHASRPNTICFSTFRVAPKLIIENANKEIVALLIHELAHMLGANETEARELQKWTTVFMRGVTHEFVENLENQMWDLANIFETFYRGQERIREAVQKNDLQSIEKELQSWQDQLNVYDVLFSDKDLALLDYSVKEYEYVLQAKILLAKLFVSSLNSTSAEYGWAKKEYEECFANQTQIPANEFTKNCLVSWVQDDNIYGNYVISKLTSLTELEQYLRDVVLYSHDLGSHLRAIAFDGVLPVFHLPTSSQEAHPWLKFVGNYKTTLIGCTTTEGDSFNPFDDLREIKIQPNVVNYPVKDIPTVSVQEIRQNSSMTDSYYNENGADLMRVSGDSAKAVMTTERGTRWYDRQGHGWNKTMKSIEQVNGKLILTMQQDYFHYDHRGVYQSGRGCQYQLTPQ